MAVDTEAVAFLAARQVHEKYQGYLELEDLQQEARIWVYTHPDRVQQKLDRSDNDGAAANWLRRDITAYLEGLAIQAKAAMVGYEVDDIQWYGQGLIASVLPQVLTGDRGQPSAALDGSPRAQNDPAEGNTWAAMYADVSKALKASDVDDIELLVDRYVDGLSYDDLADRWGCAVSTAHRRVQRAERRLVEKLGGSKPKTCPPNCEHWEHGEALRRRPGRTSEVW